jgi:hypothetical protein
MSNQFNLTTVFTSIYAWEAHLAHHALEKNGVDSCIIDDGLVSANWMYANAVGGVQPRVPTAMPIGREQFSQLFMSRGGMTEAESRKSPVE